VNKITTIKERIRQFAEKQNITKELFFSSIGMTSANFRGNKLNRPINSDAIEKLVSVYPNVDLHWLITGEHKKEVVDALNESAAVYKKETITSDILALRNGQEIIMRQNAEILEKLNRGILKDLIKAEKDSVGKSKTNKER